MDTGEIIVVITIAVITGGMVLLLAGRFSSSDADQKIRGVFTEKELAQFQKVDNATLPSFVYKFWESCGYGRTGKNLTIYYTGTDMTAQALFDSLKTYHLCSSLAQKSCGCGERNDTNVEDCENRIAVDGNVHTIRCDAATHTLLLENYPPHCYADKACSMGDACPAHRKCVNNFLTDCAKDNPACTPCSTICSTAAVPNAASNTNYCTTGTCYTCQYLPCNGACCATGQSCDGTVCKTPTPSNPVPPAVPYSFPTDFYTQCLSMPTGSPIVLKCEEMAGRICSTTAVINATKMAAACTAGDCYACDQGFLPANGKCEAIGLCPAPSLTFTHVVDWKPFDAAMCLAYPISSTNGYGCWCGTIFDTYHTQPEDCLLSLYSGIRINGPYLVADQEMKGTKRTNTWMQAGIRLFSLANPTQPTAVDRPAWSQGGRYDADVPNIYLNPHGIFTCLGMAVSSDGRYGDCEIYDSGAPQHVPLTPSGGAILGSAFLNSDPISGIIHYNGHYYSLYYETIEDITTLFSPAFRGFGGKVDANGKVVDYNGQNPSADYTPGAPVVPTGVEFGPKVGFDDGKFAMITPGPDRRKILKVYAIGQQTPIAQHALPNSESANPASFTSDPTYQDQLSFTILGTETGGNKYFFVYFLDPRVGLCNAFTADPYTLLYAYRLDASGTITPIVEGVPLPRGWIAGRTATVVNGKATLVLAMRPDFGQSTIVLRAYTVNDLSAGKGACDSATLIQAPLRWGVGLGLSMASYTTGSDTYLYTMNNVGGTIGIYKIA